MRALMTRTANTRLAALLLTAGSFLSGPAAFAADPQLLNLVMPDVKALGGINATNAKITPLGQFILSKVPGTDQHLQAFIAATGFDPRQDVAEVLAASTGDPANPSGLVLVRGTFQVDKIAATLGAQPGATVATYDGSTLISSTGPKQKVPQGLAFLGSNIAIAGDLVSVKAALDRSQANNSLDPALAVKVNDLSTTDDAWFLSTVAAGSFAPNKAPTGPAATILPLLKSIQSSSGGVKLGSNVQIALEAVTADPQSATSLAAVLNLLKAFAASNAQLQAALPLIQQIQVTTNGAAVDLSLSIPESQIETIAASLPKHQAVPNQPQPQARRRRSPPPATN